MDSMELPAILLPIDFPFAHKSANIDLHCKMSLAYSKSSLLVNVHKDWDHSGGALQSVRAKQCHVNAMQVANLILGRSCSWTSLGGLEGLGCCIQGQLKRALSNLTSEESLRDWVCSISGRYCLVLTDLAAAGTFLFT
jgi:hypothetical protein